MSSNSIINLNKTSHNLIETLTLIKQEYLLYIPLIFIFFGTIGFIGNVFTFLQPTLRYNTCCIYSPGGSIIDVINLYINLLPNYTYALTDNLLSLTTSRWSCRWRLFSLCFLPQFSINLLTLSLIDQYACTCSLTSSIRHIRQLKMLPWMILITLFISGVISLYAPLYYDVIPTLGCVNTDPFVNSILYIIIHGFLAPSVMFVFVILTYRNVVSSRRRAGINNLVNIDRSRNPFIRMIFTQVFITSFLILQWIGFYIYHVITVHDLQTTEQLVVRYFIWYITNNIYYLIHVKSFYLSTLTSRLFRQTFLKSLCQLVPYYQSRQESSKIPSSYHLTSSKAKGDDE